MFIRRADKTTPEYLPLCSREDLYINEQQASIRSWLDANGMTGSLNPVDELLLYELAYYTDKAIFEIGTGGGRSTACLFAGASHHETTVITTDPSLLAATRQRLESTVSYSGRRLIMRQASGRHVLSRTGIRFSVVFIDGNHSFPEVVADLKTVRPRLRPGAFVALHDLYHGANRTLPRRYGVDRAVHQELREPEFLFYGRYGAIGLFRYTEDEDYIKHLNRPSRTKGSVAVL